jgi:predicted N-acetyltransferase YhbS
MDVQFEKARPEDYEDLIDFGNFVFSQAHSPHDFPAFLPKLYRREYFMDGIHYLAREGGRIKAAVGAYPLDWEFGPSGSLPGRGIGMVSVHPYSRSKGYMKTLMNMALEDMRRDGIVWSCLGGQRQRYEYFGYTSTGSAYTFNCDEANIRHTLGPDWKSGLSLRLLSPGDGAFLDRIEALHRAKPSRIRRSRDRLFDILSTWRAEVYAVSEGDLFEGYLLHQGGWNGGSAIGEINLKNQDRFPEVLGLFLRRQREMGGQGSVRVSAGPHEGEKLAAMARFAEDCAQSPAYQFAVFDYRRFIEPFLRLRARQRKLAEGSIVIQIKGGPRLRLEVSGGEASLTESAGPPDLSLDDGEALRCFFSPLDSLSSPVIGERPFLQSLFPLPLFFEHADGV